MNQAYGDRLIGKLRERVNGRLDSIIRSAQPAEIRRALQHVIGAGGKRVRSVVTLLSCEAVGGRSQRALNAAVALELLHAFTLVHDDIMDHAPTRRGRPTVHNKWGLSYGILSGDVLLGLAYRALGETRTGRSGDLVRLFTRGLLDVCEGQALDLRLEAEPPGQLPAYFRMIEKKTAALFSLSAAAGGLVGGGGRRHVAALGKFGHHLGRAFQVQDDLLDVIADERTFGKIVGGDILEGKKTFLFLHAFGKAKGMDRTILREVMQRRRSGGGRATIRRVTGVYRNLGAIERAQDRITFETDHAAMALRNLPSNRGTEMLSWIAGALKTRMF